MKNLNKAVQIQRFFDEAPLEVAELILGLAQAAVTARRQANAPDNAPVTGKRRGRPPGSKNRAAVPAPAEDSTHIPVPLRHP